jgi:hypothetical protein
MYLAAIVFVTVLFSALGARVMQWQVKFFAYTYTAHGLRELSPHLQKHTILSNVPSVFIHEAANINVFYVAFLRYSSHGTTNYRIRTVMAKAYVHRYSFASDSGWDQTQAF